MTTAERVATAVLGSYSGPYAACADKWKTNAAILSAQQRVIREAARNIEPLIREIEDSARRAVDFNAS